MLKMNKLCCLLLPLLCLTILSGCRVQTLYYHGEASGVVVDAVTQAPIVNAEVFFNGVTVHTAEDGSFQMDEKQGRELVMFLAGRSPLDYKRQGFIRISAPGYQQRRWMTEYNATYLYPIKLLKLASPLRYPPADNTDDRDLQAPPAKDELFTPEP